MILIRPLALHPDRAQSDDKVRIQTNDAVERLYGFLYDMLEAWVEWKDISIATKAHYMEGRGTGNLDPGIWSSTGSHEVTIGHVW